MSTRARRFITLVAVLLVVTGVALRASRVASSILWVDEAESGINALTILEHGVPVDHYLGLPVYENTLVVPWPESEEYEFRDVSYSNRGVAIYHGWLPLYAIAGALAAFGIEPDHAGGAPIVRHSGDDLWRRTVVPRLPSLLFSALFLVALFALGHAVGGTDVALTLLCAGSLTSPLLWFGWQARYYSAALALSAVTGLFVWRATQRGGWRDFVLLASALVALFHTHILSFLIMGGALAAMLPFALRLERWLPKLLLTGAIVTFGTLPWMLATGFLHAIGRIPPIWALLRYPDDLIAYPAGHLTFSALIGFGLGISLFALFVRRGSIGRIIQPFRAEWRAFLFAAAWAAVAFLAFHFLIPAASYFRGRITLVVGIPGLLLASLTLTIALRAMASLWSHLLSPIAMVLLLFAVDRLGVEIEKTPASDPLFNFIEIARGWELRPGTRLYATPSLHLVLTYYTGIPVQSIAPVRKSFLDRYVGDVVLIEMSRQESPVAPDWIVRTAREMGLDVGSEEAERISRQCVMLAAKRDLETLGMRTAPSLPPPTPLEQRVLVQQNLITATNAIERAAEVPMLRGYSTAAHQAWWPIFFYRFVDPLSRIGSGANYAQRMAGAQVLILPNGWLVWDGRSVPEPPLFRSGDEERLLPR